MPEFTQTLAAPTLLTAQPQANSLDDIDTIMELYRARVFRFLMLTLRDRDAAETLTQETFLRAWTARASFRSDCSIATWLIRIALNLARDHTRTGRFRFWKAASSNSIDVSEIAASIPETSASAETRLIANEQIQLIWQSVAGLSERQRTIFLLRFTEEMEIPEIAELTGMPLGTIKSHLYRAIAVIRARHNDGSSGKKERL